MPTPIRRASRRGIPGWLYPDGRWLPVIAGGAGEDGGGDGSGGGDGAPAALIVPAGTGDQQPPAPAVPAATDELGDAGKRALDAERVRAKEAEKRARAAEQRAKALEDASLSETEKLKREAEEGRSLAERATGKLRRANLISALADEGFSGAKARAAAKLVEGVEYDDDDEPTNLKQALKSAEREYGDLVKPAPAPATDFDGGARSAAPPSSMDALIRRAAGRSTL
jgi:hypothetical protein